VDNDVYIFVKSPIPMHTIRWKVISGSNSFSEQVDDALSAVRHKIGARAPLQVSEIDDVPWDRFALANRDGIHTLCHGLKQGESLLGNQLIATRAKLRAEPLGNLPAAALLETIGIGDRTFNRKQYASLGRVAIERGMELAGRRGEHGPSVFTANDWTGQGDLDESTVVKLLSTATASTFGAMTPANLFDLVHSAATEKQPWKMAMFAAVYGPQLKSLSIPKMKLNEILVRGIELSGQKGLLEDVRQLIADSGSSSLSDSSFANSARQFREAQAARTGLLWKGINPVGAYELSTERSLDFHGRRRVAPGAGVVAGINDLASSLDATARKVRSKSKTNHPQPDQVQLL
jgi:hypothetical protein